MRPGHRHAFSGRALGRDSRGRQSELLGPVPLRVIRYRGDAAASPAMSAVSPRAEVNSPARLSNFRTANTDLNRIFQFRRRVRAPAQPVSKRLHLRFSTPLPFVAYPLLLAAA